MNVATRPQILDRMQVLSDPMRSRLLALLDGVELTVSELCDVLQAPQSTVSRHLRVLADDGWIVARREGTNRHYTMAGETLDEGAVELWAVVREHVSGDVQGEEDVLRLESVLATRRARSREFFDRSAGEWDALRQELFGELVEQSALMALLDDRWVVGDLGCGTGRAAASLADWVEQVVAVDSSISMIEEGPASPRAVRERRSAPGPSSSVCPIADGELDAAMMTLVLHHLSSPELAFTEVARSLRPGGRLVLIDMTPHERVEYRDQMGHQWLGFSRRRDRRLARALRFRIHTLSPPSPRAGGEGTDSLRRHRDPRR